MNQHTAQSKTDKAATPAVDMAAPLLITTIIPTFRRPKLLKRAIESALNQTYPHVRVCVYDNASGDETADVVANLIKKDSRVSYRCHSENIGALGNFNCGLKNVQTPFFSLLSDDDILLPEFYETAMKGFVDHPEAAFSSTDVIVVNADGTYVGRSNAKWEEGCYDPAKGLPAIFENNTRTPTWTGILYRAMVIESTGLLDHETNVLADQDFTLRIAARFSFVISKIPGAIFVNHPAGFGGHPDQDGEWLAWQRIMGKVSGNAYISSALKQEVGRHLSRERKAAVLRHGRSSILFKKYDHAYRMATVLQRDCDAKALAVAIWTTAQCCQHLPWFHRGLVFLNNLRHRLRSARIRESCPQAELYTHFINDA
jgi:glycosyltransferase involved in cell wall biosynthesis